MIQRFIQKATNRKDMRTCESCGKVKFYSLNFLFSNIICNECYMKMKEKQQKKKENDDYNSKPA